MIDDSPGIDLKFLSLLAFLVAVATDVQDEVVLRRASVSGVVIGRDQIGIGASRVARSTGGSGAGAIVRGDGEALGGELRAGTHVDAREIPEDRVTGESVLELEDIGLGRLGGELDGDTTAVGVGLPGLRVGATVGLEGDHGDIRIVGNGPGIEVAAQVVDNGDSTASGLSGSGSVGGTGDDLSRERGGNSSKDGSKTEDLGEHHLDFLCLIGGSDDVGRYCCCKD